MPRPGGVIFVRCEPELVRQIDKLADGYDLTRQQFVVKMLRLMVQSQAAFSGEPSLFGQGVEELFERALNKVLRAGGVDLVLAKAGQVRKSIRKGKR